MDTNHHTSRSPWRSTLEAILMVVMIAVGVAMLWEMYTEHRPVAPALARAARPKPPEPKPPADPVSIEGAALQGSTTAKVAVIIYSDFQCPYCGIFARDTLPSVIDRYVKSGKVRLAFRNFPLEQLHPFALRAAEVADCAGRQGQFFQMHDALFHDQPHLDDQSLRERAKTLGLDMKQFDACLAGPVADKVKADEAGGKAVAITGTPTFFVGTVQADGRVKVTTRLSGALPPAQFATAIDALLAQVSVVAAR